MNFNKTAEQLQTLFQETNKCVKGNWIAPQTDEIVKILQDNQKGGDATCAMQTESIQATSRPGNAAPTVQSASASHHKNPTQPTVLSAPEQQPDLSAIERSHAAHREPRIYTRCPACFNNTLTINKGRHLLCTWHKCPNPTLIDSVGPLGAQPKPVLQDNLSGGGEGSTQPLLAAASVAQADASADARSEAQGSAPPAQSSQREPCPICDKPLKPGWHTENIGGIRVPVKDDELPAWSGAAQPKPESWPEIAGEAADEIGLAIARLGLTPKGHQVVADIVLAHIERSHAAQPQSNPCPLSFSHLPHDYCDGKPTAPVIGQQTQPQPSKASPLGERSDNLSDTKRQSVREAVKDEANRRPSVTHGSDQPPSLDRATDESGPDWMLGKIAQLEGQLLSALAAIEKHNKDMGRDTHLHVSIDLSALREHDDELEANYAKNQKDISLIITAAMMEAGMSDDQTVAELPDTIRSLRALVISQQEVTCGLQNLEDHDAEVRKPLVDALRDCGCRLRELTRCYEERWGNAHTKDFHDLIATCDALAKVKEGK